MASLTHVCMWSGNGWKRITAEEAALLHPRGKVSAHSGLFMCELCGQYVLLTDSKVRIRHFRHSSSEKSKDCPERTFGPGVSISYNAIEHELPIRIQNITNSGFELEMGFIQIPENLLSRLLRIKIKPNSCEDQPFVYLKERIKAEGITYLSIGSIPSQEYSISVSGTDNSIYQFWPETVHGIDPQGTLFDAESGKKMVYDSDVSVGKKYYLLRKGHVLDIRSSHISIKEVLRKQISWESWGLYEIVANDYNAATARFFLDYHCRLTEDPVGICTVWPVYVETPYVTKHNNNSVVMHILGNVTMPKAYPDSEIKKYSCETGSVYELSCNSRQQLISAGRTKALQYMYFWKEPLNQTTEKPKAAVTDLQGDLYDGGEYNILPDKGVLRITVPYDGVLTTKEKGELIDRRKLFANTSLEINEIRWNVEIEIRVGLDRVWMASFIRKSKNNSKEVETKILYRLQSYGGPQMEVPHTLGSIVSKLTDYPNIQRWLYKCIRTGSMSAFAYRELQSWVISKE